MKYAPNPEDTRLPWKKSTDGVSFSAVSVSQVQEVAMGQWAQLEC